MTTDWPSFLLGGIVAILARFLWDAWMEYRREKQRKQLVSDIDGAIVLIARIPHTSMPTEDDAQDAIAALEKEWREKNNS